MEPIDDLLVGLYEAAVDPVAFGRLPEVARRVFGGESGMLFTARVGEGVRALAHDLPCPKFFSEYNEYYNQVDLRWLACPSMPDGVFDMDQVVSPEDWRQSEIHNEFSLPNDHDVTHCLVSMFCVGGGLAGFAVHRSYREGPFGTGSLAQLERVHPHLKRMFQIREAVQSSSERAAMAEASLHALSTGLARLRGDGRILYANRSAEAAFRRRDGLRIRLGRCTADDSRAARRLADAFHSAATKTGLMGGVVQAPRTACGAKPYTLVVSPLPESSECGQGQVLLLIDDGETVATPLAGQLMQLFGLTHAEAELAIALSNGKSLREIAEERLVKITTVRTQAQSVLDKTGAERQAKLVALLAHMPHVRDPT